LSRGEPQDKKPPPEPPGGRKEANMKILYKQGGIWYAGGKPYKSLHEAVKTLRS